MFETDPVLWLQSLESEWLTAFLVLISRSGDWPGYVVLALVVTFGFNFRYGMVLFQMILWNGVLTSLLKESFALPRPAEVDSAVQLLGRDTVNTTPFHEMDGDHFLDLPEPAAIEYYREQSDVAYGLPSGHVSMATTFWIGGASLFRRPSVTVVAAVIVTLMAISRMYLGRHFLADVVGGFLLGLGVVLGVRYLIRTMTAWMPTLCLQYSTETEPRPTLPLVALPLIAIPLVVLMLHPEAGVYPVSRLLAANVAFAVLHVSGLPRGVGTARVRIAAALIAIALYAGSAEGVEWLLRVVGWDQTIGGQFVDGAVPILTPLLGTPWLGRALGLFGGRTRLVLAAEVR